MRAGALRSNPQQIRRWQTADTLSVAPETVVPIIEAVFADNFIVLVMSRQVFADDDSLRVIYSIPRLT
jgi:hypothetical protein